MGIFARLFGSSDRKDDVVGGRCNDCGMAGGTHTDWCPAAEGGTRDETPAATGRDDQAREPEERPPLQA